MPVEQDTLHKNLKPPYWFTSPFVIPPTTDGIDTFIEMVLKVMEPGGPELSTR